MSRRVPGSAHVPRAGEAVSDSRTFLGAQFWRQGNAPQKDCFGATPNPARETHALPKLQHRFAQARVQIVNNLFDDRGIGAREHE